MKLEEIPQKMSKGCKNMFCKQKSYLLSPVAMLRPIKWQLQWDKQM